MKKLYIGLMSGTSMDSVDAALVDFSRTPKVLATHGKTMPDALRNRLLSLTQSGDNEIERMAECDVELGDLFADTALELMEKANVKAKDIVAIGSHGQTIRHLPENHFSLQIADPNRIAARTKVATVADFRRGNLAHNGHGAPLTPAFHEEFFYSAHENRIVVNIGGFANLTFIPSDKEKDVIAFDTGPGNALIDAWILRHKNLRFDEGGKWAREGEVLVDLLAEFMSDTYFSTKYPKSTGHEDFNLKWVEDYLSDESPVDVQRTLLDLTAMGIWVGINEIRDDYKQIILCGGGVKNTLLYETICDTPYGVKVTTSEDFGISPDYLEAAAFAWLAKQTVEGNTIDLCSATGAEIESVLGGVYYV